jgi:hypothetical protein
MGALALWETEKSCGKRSCRSGKNVKQMLAAEGFCTRLGQPIIARTKKRARWKTTGFDCPILDR